MRRLSSLAVSVALVVASVHRVEAGTTALAIKIDRPVGHGDQVIYYYDARDNFTTFLAVRNEGQSALVAELCLFNGAFTSVVRLTFPLPAGGLEVFDVGTLKRDAGLPATVGVATIQAIDGSNRPIVTRALSGNFTVANLQTGSAWGSPAAARLALEDNGVAFVEPVPNTNVNGTTVLYTPIQPTGVDLAAYYDPATLAPPAQGGNQLVFVNFVDVPGTIYDAQSGSTLWNVAAVRNSGTPVGATSFTANGVTVSDLASVAGPGVTGAPGSIRFTADPTGAALTRLVFVAEALGTFGTGYLLPPVPAPTS